MQINYNLIILFNITKSIFVFLIFLLKKYIYKYSVSQNVFNIYNFKFNNIN